MHLVGPFLLQKDKKHESPAAFSVFCLRFLLRAPSRIRIQNAYHRDDKLFVSEKKRKIGKKTADKRWDPVFGHNPVCERARGCGFPVPVAVNGVCWLGDRRGLVRVSSLSGWICLSAWGGCVSRGVCSWVRVRVMCGLPFLL